MGCLEGCLEGLFRLLVLATSITFVVFFCIVGGVLFLGIPGVIGGFLLWLAIARIGIILEERLGEWGLQLVGEELIETIKKPKEEDENPIFHYLGKLLVLAAASLQGSIWLVLLMLWGILYMAGFFS